MTSLRIAVLGAAAGGGFPQWNAHSEACRRARAGDPAAKPRTQASIAVSADDHRWVLINASPDLRQQIEANPTLWPSEGLRSSPIAAVLLTNGDVDAIAGLLHLREGTPFALYGHAKVLGVLEQNPIFAVVSRKLVLRRALPLEEPVEPADATGGGLGFRVTAFLAPGKMPLYLEGEGPIRTDAEEGDTLGLELEAHGKRLVYLANCARVTETVRERVAGADLLFMDGTLWEDEEMITQGVGVKTGGRMGHVSMSGPEGAIARLAGLPIGRRLFIHVNNTNPAILDDSPERAILRAAGWEVAMDGQEIRL